MIKIVTMEIIVVMITRMIVVMTHGNDAQQQVDGILATHSRKMHYGGSCIMGQSAYR